MEGRSIRDLLIDSNSDKQSGHRYGFVYDLLFTYVYKKKGNPLRASLLRVLEIGVSEFGVGSFFAYQESELVETVVGIDTQEYRGELTDKMRFYQKDAYEKETISFLKEIEEPFDIIIDDGTHTYKDQTFFLDNYDELLSEHGLLVCEDVAALKLINEQCENEKVFFFDGWGNREVKVDSLSTKAMTQHAERMLIKAKSEKLTEAKIHESKPHIPRLPIQPFGDYHRDNTELAISVPLFHPEMKGYNPQNFQDVHCNGAIWAGLSMIKNSDLGDNGVPLYFHIEDKVWDDAMPVFRKYGISEDWCRRMTLPPLFDDSPDVVSTGKPQYGKSWMALLDTELDPDIMLILDSDLFTLSTGSKLPLYKKLTLPVLKNQPAMTYFQMRPFPFYWWTSIILLASGMTDKIMYKRPMPELEQEAYQRLGFEIEKSENASNEVVQHFYTEDYLMTFPRSHPARDFAVSRLPQCYATPYIFSVWSEFNQPFLELNQILGVPTYDWEEHFIEGSRGYNCFAHIRAKRGEHKRLTMPSRIDEYWEQFLEHISRHTNT